MNLEKAKIKKRFSEINESLSEIKRLTSVPKKDFWAKKENMAAVKYYLIQAVEATGSVCAHVAAKKYNKGVSSFGECFEVLEKEKSISKKLAKRLKEMARFRNKLIHQYWEADNELIFDYSKNNLGDFEEFMKAIGKIIK